MTVGNGEKQYVLAIAGPTASGKTALSTALAERLDGEIVSCDSMQIYRGMDIGTAKPTIEERRGIPHHMIDVVDPHSENPFNCADYVAMAAECIRDISARGKLPIVCGGTGLYMDCLLFANVFSAVSTDSTVREELARLDTVELYEELKRVDPQSASAVHPNNRVRVERALEIYRVSGTPKSEWDRRSREHGSPYDFKVLGLRTESRELLYKRIRDRVDRMMEDGLEGEVRSLALRPGTTASAAIGYKELTEYIEGRVSLSAAVENIKLASTRYAKRQLTWFNRKKYIKWIETDNKMFASEEDIVNFSLKSL